MSLSTGTRLGPYEILGHLGAGGMGEVYRAKDTRLGRDVAIKVLPAIFARDETFRARFDREAKSISSLNHPHICALYDIGHQQGTDFLVMELLEGESLADRLEKGPLPLEQSLRFGSQIALALHHAHRQGIVHRDLKPGNVMLTKSGAKLLDFGLARTAAGGAAPVQGLTTLPTQAKPLTTEGAILGTFQYMAPEQLEGEEADARTDIFALGAVLYEMATGRKAFQGKSRTSLIAAIVSSQPPPISTLQAMSPPLLDHVVRKCLEKEPDDRWQSAQDVAAQLKWIGDSGSHPGSAAAPLGMGKARRRGGAGPAWIAAAVFALIALALGTALVLRRPVPRQVMRTSIALPEGYRIRYEGIQPGPPAVSPDGARIAMVLVSPKGVSRLWIRDLDNTQPRELEGTDDASYPFWAPDGRAIGFFAGGKLKTVSVAGGSPLVLAEAPSGKGGTWNSEGTVLFAPSFSGPIHRVPATGGDSVPVTKLDAGKGESSHRFPVFLPDGRHFLYLSRGIGAGGNTLWAGSLDGGEPVLVAPLESQAAYAPGHLLFARGGTLMAQSFDPKSLSLAGEAIPVADGVHVLPGAARSVFSVSQSGVLVFQPGASSGAMSRLVILDRNGKELRSLSELRAPANAPSVAPDGRTIAFEDVGDSSEKLAVWTLDVARGARARLTTSAATEVGPRFSPKGDSILFASSREGPLTLYVKTLDRAADEHPVLKQGRTGYDPDWSPDGRTLLFTVRDPKTLEDLWVTPVDGSADPRPYIASGVSEATGRFSPDGRWVAYTSGGGEHYQVTVTSFPEPGRHWQISVDGGTAPVWRPDGKEILFKSLDNRLMAADFSSKGAEVGIGVPHTLFSLPSFFQFGIMPDGKEIVAIVPPPETAVLPLTVVSDWTSALEKP